MPENERNPMSGEVEELAKILHSQHYKDLRHKFAWDDPNNFQNGWRTRAREIIDLGYRKPRPGEDAGKQICAKCGEYTYDCTCQPEELKPLIYKEVFDTMWEEVERTGGTLLSDLTKVIVKKFGQPRLDEEGINKIINSYKVDEVMTINISTVSDIKEFFNQHLEALRLDICQRLGKK